MKSLRCFQHALPTFFPSRNNLDTWLVYIMAPEHAKGVPKLDKGHSSTGPAHTRA